MAVAMLMAGCANDDEFVKKGGPVSVELAYALSSQVTNQPTRQAAAVITGNDNPRLPLPQSMIIIPNINGNPSFIDYSWGDPVLKPGAGNNPTSMLYRTRYCEIGTGVNGFRIYGGVPQLPPYTKMYNGSLIETFPESFTTVADLESISFNLETIYKSEDYASTNGIPEGAQALADCMTAIATTSGFNTSTDDAIKEIFDRFTNEGNVLPGSAASVRKWIEVFQASISTSLNSGNPSILDAVNTVATEQLSAISSLTYPRDINLPDGAAVLRWIAVGENNETVNKFVPLINTTTIANINSMARFAYPAPLYYYVSCPIMTSEEKVDLATLYSEVTTDGSKTAWDKVLANANFTKTSVTDNTRAVVLTQPVQFAVAQLKVKIKAYGPTLRDAGNEPVTIGPESFPLKGIVVCDQRSVDYRFLPKEATPGTASDADVLFIYDNQITTNDPYLTTVEGEKNWKEVCNTLVLQSHKDEDVNIILEFENNSDKDFECLDGIVYRGTRFYMIGRVEASLYKTPDQNVNDENRGQVFTKDYITTVNMTVSSLAKAYNVPPNLLSPNLEIGVETTPQWEGATPTVIRLE